MKSAIKKASVVRRLALVVISLLFTLTLTAPAAHAATPPSPQPCKNPETTELVDNYLVDSTGKPPIVLTYDKIEGKPDTIVTLPSKSFTFRVDFSQLQSVFGGTNSNYLEGNFQNETHLQKNILGLKSQDFNEYYKGLQKLTPKVVIDEQKVNYVKAITGTSDDPKKDKHTLPEAANKYTDIRGQGDPKTVYDLVAEYGQPNPPQANASDEEKSAWENTWGKYWPKIPTAYSDFYKAEINFLPAAGDNIIFKVREGEYCPLPIDPKINFVMPDFYRTTAVSDQLNRLLIPIAAQSYQEHGILNPSPSPNPVTTKNSNPIADFFSYCWKLLTSPSPISKEIKKTISLNLPNLLVTPVLAENQADEICIKPLLNAKGGQAPYCPLPQEEFARLRPTCLNKTDSQKLEKDNPNVDCTFTFQTGPINYTILEKDPEDTAQAEPECKDEDDKGVKDGIFVCQPKVYIIPDFRIPWISAIWNNTLFSENGPGVPYNTEDNRPGIYTFFTPQAVSYELFPPSFENLNADCLKGEKRACDKMDEIWDKVREKCQPQPGSAINPDPTQWRNEIRCMDEVIDNTLPGQVSKNSTDPKQRFIGAVDCSKHFVRDLALKPIALQEELGIDPKCDLTAQAQPGSGTTPPSGPPIVGDSCGGKYNSGNSPQGNFGDPNCDFSSNNLYTYLQTVAQSGPVFQVGSVDWWFYKIVACESVYNPNAWRNPNIEPRTPDPNGAWGLYQIGSTGLANPRYDFGNVEWKRQTQNAIGLLRENGTGYWECS